jgi:hypothetical protein
MRLRNLAVLAALAACSAQAGLIGFYQFDGNFNDSSGNGNDAIMANQVSFGTGFNGQAGVFNGSFSYVEIPININPSAMTLLTMGAWVLPDNVNPIRAIISHDNGGFDRNLNIDNRGGCATTGCYSAFTGAGVLSGTAATANPANWVFVAATYNSQTGLIKLFVDGNSVGTTSTLGSGFTTTFIGRNPGFVEFFSGKIDNVFFFNQILTDTQISDIRGGGAEAILRYAAVQPTGVPEPSTFVLAGLGLVAAGFLRRRS